MEIDNEAVRKKTEKREAGRWRITTALGAALVLVGGAIFGKQVFDPPLEIHPFELELPRLDPAFAGYRLVQISDIHMDSMKPERLEEIVSQVNALNPDLIVITGDFVTHEPQRYHRVLVDNLKNLRARDGVYAVLGNHDHWAGPAEVRRILHEAGIIELDNRVVNIQRSDAVFYLAGVDCTYVGADRLDQVLNALPGDDAAILLAHEPDYAVESAPTDRFDLQLSGHSHGGQARFPLIGSPFLPPLARKYPYGLYQVGSMKLYTNRGLGAIYVAARFNVRPEVALITLCPPVPTGR